METKNAASGKLTSSELIISATRRLLKRQGYRRTSMDDIAQEAGLAKATLYLHFAGKSAIVRSMFQRCREEIDARAAEADADIDDVAAALAGIIEAHLSTAIDWFGSSEHLRELSRLVADDPESFRVPPATEMDDRMLYVLAQAEANGTIKPRQRGAARLLVEVLQDCANGIKQCEAMDAQEFGKRIQRAAPVILDGLFTKGVLSHEV